MAIDVAERKMIRKGTKVSLTTTNGGKTARILLEDYRPTYAAVISDQTGGYIVVPGYRIKNVEELKGVYGAIQVGQHYCDSDASIYKVVMVRDMPNDEVQIGIEPTWKNHRGTEYITRGVLVEIPRSISVYNAPAIEADAAPGL
jgi:hypothetical protein